tara:strand:+ start:2976 stop:3182 length:207 start_codon:yes stop_codon:yes gene_type:complete
MQIKVTIAHRIGNGPILTSIITNVDSMDYEGLLQTAVDYHKVSKDEYYIVDNQPSYNERTPSDDVHIE